MLLWSTSEQSDGKNMTGTPGKQSEIVLSETFLGGFCHLIIYISRLGLVIGRSCYGVIDGTGFFPLKRTMRAPRSCWLNRLSAIKLNCMAMFSRETIFIYSHVRQSQAQPLV